MNATNQRHTVTEFAEYLQVPRPKLSRWLQGNLLPAGKNVHILASKLGIEVYDFIGFEHPDNRTQFMVHNWYQLDNNQKQLIYKYYIELIKNS